MVDIVAEAFEKVAKEKANYKSTAVEKLLDLDVDLGTLLAIDTNDIDSKKLSSSRDEYLLNLARDNTQLLLNKIWDLPSEKVEETVVVKLPEQTYRLPREKRIPKPKPLTKWQQFAKDKGLHLRHKNKVTWDDILKMSPTELTIDIKEEPDDSISIGNKDDIVPIASRSSDKIEVPEDTLLPNLLPPVAEPAPPGME